MTGRRLVADLGGTNVRFAVTDATHRLAHIQAYKLDDHPSFLAALAAYLATLPQPAAPPDAIAIGAAGPVIAGRVRLTNATWDIDAGEVARAARAGLALLVNDLEPVARAIPDLQASEIDVIRTGTAARGTVVDGALAVNVGTGFGAAPIHRITIAEREQWLTSATEAGHMLAPSIDGQPTPPPGATLEDTLSGAGVVRLARALGMADGDATGAEDIFRAAGRNPIATRVAETFGARLGAAIRDLVLAHGAWNGIFLTGSVVEGWHASGATGSMLAAFDRDGPMAERLRQVGIAVITRPYPALLGLSLLIADHLETASSGPSH